jgi:DAK2 domain fusion protein YloV
MGADSVDGKKLQEMFASATDWLEKGASEINAINVFPIPDGDTGTNMVLTMRSALEEARRALGQSASSVAKSLARGALMGARGNSGVILAKFWQGIARALNGKDYVNGKDFARALATALQTAYQGVANPVEGTILTVLKDASRGAEETAKEDDNLVSVLEAAVRSARESVARTPSLLPVLRQAGVVDAGGQGLYVLLDGALRFLKGEANNLEYRRPYLVAPESELLPRVAQMPVELERPEGYCINFALEGQRLNLKKIEKALKRKGNSLILSGDESLVRIHIHSSNLGDVLGYAARIGVLHHIVITNMMDQYKEFIEMQRKKVPQIDVAVVAVASGEGFLNIFRNLGNVTVVPGGDSMNPSVRELLEAVEASPSNNIILLPNNRNVIAAASQVQSLTAKNVELLPSATIPQGIAACLAFNYDMSLRENLQAMEKAMRRVRTIAVSQAVREATISSFNIKKGNFIAVLDDENVIAAGKEIEAIVLNALGKIGMESVELITIYYGAGTDIGEAERIAAMMRESYRKQVEVVYGGQPYYSYIIALE